MTLPLECPSCGAPLTPGATACANCGQQITAQRKSLGATVQMSPYDAPTLIQQPGRTGATEPRAPETGMVSRMVEALKAATAGEYEIVRELGRGGMAVVFQAHDLSLDREVAIKVMSPALLDAEGGTERFKREARTAAGLSHPHIIPIHAVRESGDVLFFVMKYVEGRPLDDVIRSQGALPIPMVVQILSEVAGALGYAHKRGVIHRDVKPANVMIDDGGWAVVADFGIAKVTQKKGLTMTGMTVGTPAYMSPEQCMDKNIDGRSDQYSLGIVGYELLSGRVPFQADSMLEMFMAQVNTTPEPVLSVRPDCPPQLAEIIERMIAKSADARFASLDDVAAALGVIHKSEPKERTRHSMVALGRIDDEAEAKMIAARAETAGLSAARSATPLAVEQAGARTVSAPGRRSGIPRWVWPAAAVLVIAAGGAWMATHRPAPSPTATKSPTVVVTVPVAHIALSPENSTILVEGSAPLAIALRDSGDRAITGRPVRWTSTSPTIATVDSNGVVHGQKVGTTTVTAQSEGHTATATVTVTDKVLVAKSIAVSPRDSSIDVGAKLALVANVAGDKGANLIGTPVSWKSSAPGVATVDSTTGLITALKPGTTTIAATIKNGPRTSTRVTVLAPRAAVASVALSPSTLAPGVGDTARPQATPVDARGGAAAPAPAAPAANTKADSTADAASAGAPTFTEISAGGSTTCGALANDGGVLCWGAASTAGTIVQGLLFTKIAVGDGHICGLTPAGEAYCWGANSQGQLGDGSTTERDKPVAVKAQQRFTEISVGASHTCALSADGAAFCWGGNKNGQLGDGSQSNRNKPVLVRSTAGNKGFKALSAGGAHTCGVTQANKAYCWGDGFSGQVGNAMQDIATEPFAVKTDLSFRTIVAGERHTCGLTTSGRVYCWGDNKWGQLGNESKDDRNIPDSVSTDQIFRSIGAGAQHSCGIANSRQLLCWGNNADGRLGDGTRSSRTVPAVAANGKNFALVSAGSGHTCALTTGGQAMCWGTNTKGQLGNGATSQFSVTPIVVKVKGGG